MNSNIVFKLVSDTIIISQIKKEVDEKSLNNTNIINTKDLKFTIGYIKENFELVSNFLNVVIIKKNIINAQINNMEISSIAMDLINSWEHIKKLYFKPNKKIEFDTFLKILDNDYLEEINCYTMSSYLIDRIDVNKSLKVITRHEIEANSLFMKENFLDSYSDIYYKKMIVISNEFNEEDMIDFDTFIKINNRLKVIRIIKYSNELLTTIVNKLKENKKENIKIEIEEKNNDLNVIFNSVNYLKHSYHKYFDEANINFKLNYSKEYKSKNFFKQINFKIITSIILMIIVVSSISIGAKYYFQHIDEVSINNQMEELENIFEDASIMERPTSSSTIATTKNNKTETTTTKKKATSSSPYYTNYSQVFENLLKKNNETVGWLTVNNTKINYPVVQGSTNNYYLKHDFNKKKNSMGWIFMDYRNNPKDLSKNTIIYGHNIKVGIMFGTIKYMLNSSWYKEESNRVITFNTINKNMKWQIFSIYKIPETEDYLKTDFDSDKDYLKFIDMVQSRSIYNFNVKVDKDSKILTLSTCYNHTFRNVVHAVLIEE